MNTRIRLSTLLAAALLSQQVAALEEVVVRGTDTSGRNESVAEKVLADMNAYVEELNQAQKNRLDAELAKLGQRRIQIAAAQLPTRG